MNGGRISEIEGLRNRTGVFADRNEAGRILAGLVADCALPHPLVLAIPAGGVPVAAPLAETLGCPLDVAVVSKITLPWNTEAGYGAVAFDGSYRLNKALIHSAGLSAEEVTRGIKKTRTKVERRVATFRQGRPFPDLSGHELILVDDGLASGFTMLVALAALRNAGAVAIVVAVPTGHQPALLRVALDADTVCCANIRQGASFAVASAYRYWDDVSEVAAGQILQAQGGENPQIR